MSEQIKLAFDATATPQELTGAGYYVHEILKELDTRENIDLSIITRKNDVDRFRTVAPKARVLDIAPISKAGRIAFQTFKLGPLIDSMDFDVFHGPHYQIPNKLDTPSVVTIHDMTLLTHPDVHTRIKREFFSRVIPSSAKKAKSVITVSQHTSDDVDRLIKNHGEIFVAPLGIDNQRFNPTPEPTDLSVLKTRGIKSPYIGFLGHFEPRKSIPTLIEAFSLISDEFPELRLVLAGGAGWGSSQVREAIVESGVATKIVVPGRLAHEEIAPFLRNAKIFVYPSVYEGFGMPVAEAMACGTPTITTDSSSLREVAGKGALLFKPLDTKALAESIKSLLVHETLYSQMKKKALSRANNFSWKTCADTHIEAYKHAEGIASS